MCFESEKGELKIKMKLKAALLDDKLVRTYDILIELNDSWLYQDRWLHWNV